jgi:hypothetical protein
MLRAVSDSKVTVNLKTGRNRVSYWQQTTSFYRAMRCQSPGIFYCRVVSRPINICIWNIDIRADCLPQGYVPPPSSHGATAPSGPGPPQYRGFTIALRDATLCRYPLDDGSARRKDLYLTSQTLYKTNIHAPGAIRTHDPSKRAAADPRLRPRGHWDRLTITIWSDQFSARPKPKRTDRPES